MIAKPTGYPQWCASSTTGIVEPSAETKGRGWLVGEKPPAQFLNWLHNMGDAWVRYFDRAHEGGGRFLSDDFETSEEIADTAQPGDLLWHIDRKKWLLAYSGFHVPYYYNSVDAASGASCSPSHLGFLGSYNGTIKDNVASSGLDCWGALKLGSRASIGGVGESIGVYQVGKTVTTGYYWAEARFRQIQCAAGGNSTFNLGTQDQGNPSGWGQWLEFQASGCAQYARGNLYSSTRFSMTGYVPSGKYVPDTYQTWRIERSGQVTNVTRDGELIYSEIDAAGPWPVAGNLVALNTTNDANAGMQIGLDYVRAYFDTARR